MTPFYHKRIEVAGLVEKRHAAIAAIEHMVDPTGFDGPGCTRHRSRVSDHVKQKKSDDPFCSDRSRQAGKD
jgi:hypothetical protein